jgi:hypothetical protein
MRRFLLREIFLDGVSFPFVLKETYSMLQADLLRAIRGKRVNDNYFISYTFYGIQTSFDVPFLVKRDDDNGQRRHAAKLCTFLQSGFFLVPLLESQPSTVAVDCRLSTVLSIQKCRS